MLVDSFRCIHDLKVHGGRLTQFKLWIIDVVNNSAEDLFKFGFQSIFITIDAVEYINNQLFDRTIGRVHFD